MLYLPLLFAGDKYSTVNGCLKKNTNLHLILYHPYSKRTNHDKIWMTTSAWALWFRIYFNFIETFSEKPSRSFAADSATLRSLVQLQLGS